MNAKKLLWTRFSLLLVVFAIAGGIALAGAGISPSSGVSVSVHEGFAIAQHEGASSVHASSPRAAQPQSASSEANEEDPGFASAVGSGMAPVKSVAPAQTPSEPAPASTEITVESASPILEVAPVPQPVTTVSAAISVEQRVVATQPEPTPSLSPATDVSQQQLTEATTKLLDAAPVAVHAEQQTAPTREPVRMSVVVPEAHQTAEETNVAVLLSVLQEKLSAEPAKIEQPKIETVAAPVEKASPAPTLKADDDARLALEAATERLIEVAPLPSSVKESAASLPTVKPVADEADQADIEVAPLPAIKDYEPVAPMPSAASMVSKDDEKQVAADIAPLPGKVEQDPVAPLPGKMERESIASLPAEADHAPVAPLPGKMEQESIVSLPAEADHAPVAPLPGKMEQESIVSLPAEADHAPVAPLPGKMEQESIVSLPAEADHAPVAPLPGKMEQESIVSLPAEADHAPVAPLPGKMEQESSASLPAEADHAPVAPLPSQMMNLVPATGEPNVMEMATALQEKLSRESRGIETTATLAGNSPNFGDSQTSLASFAGDAVKAPTPAAPPAPAAENQGKPMTSTFFLDQRRIGDVKAVIAQTPGDTPTNTASELARSGGLPALNFVRGDWSRTCYCWDATAMFHRPLYFEEINLERYGYTTKCPYIVQPVVSGARFFATVPILPYRMVAEPWCEQVYTLGQYRPGSCVPNQWNMLPLSVTGASAEAAVAAGLVFAVP